LDIADWIDLVDDIIQHTFIVPVKSPRTFHFDFP